MTTIAPILPYIQVILALAVIVFVLLQRSDEDLGGAFGGSDMMSTTTHTRRGFEKVIYNSTIITAVLFVLATLIGLVIR